MSLQLKTPASLLAVSLAVVKFHLKVDGSEEDADITSMILAATRAAEHRTGRSFMTQTWLLTLDAFPSCIKLSRILVASIVSVKYVDGSGALVTLDPGDYALYSQGDYVAAKLTPAYGKSWPTTRAQPDAVQVEYTTGSEDPATVPPEVVAWIKLQVGAMYKNREAEGAVQTYPLGYADRLLDGCKVYDLS
jgi:uncharacterized phiE125 gp8 family phage protein